MFRTAYWLLVSAGVAQSVTPVEKVIELLTDLKAKVESEGVTEASTYDAFSCFCRDKTTEKSSAITNGKTSIESLSSGIEEKTASRESKITDLYGRKKDHESMDKSLAETKVRLAKAGDEYRKMNADLQKAISSLDKAIQAMEDSKPALLSVKSVQHSLDLAGAMGLVAESRRQEVSSFLHGRASVDPSDPGYKYHSQSILDVLKKLRVDFGQRSSDTDAEWTKTKDVLDGEILDMEQKMQANKDAMDGLDTDIGTLKGEIAGLRDGLITAESGLKDDQLYLKDLTTRCEVRAKDWDQRSQLRADELAALAGALQILTTEVQHRDVAVNNRTVLLEREDAPATALHQAAQEAQVFSHVASPSFLQGSAVLRSHLRGGGSTALAAQARKDKAVALLSAASQRLHSTALSLVAARVAADPFTKVKDLIQKLIERLLKEATMEATKKGFCDEQVGKANKDRDFRHDETTKLALEIKDLQVKRDMLESEIYLLTQALIKLNADLADATEARETENRENLETIKTAKEGVAAVQEAILTLKVFYKRAGKATVFVQASPVDEDTTGAGFEGAYQGKQKEAKGIIGMLEVIESDFDRTFRMTQAAEAEAHADFVKFDRTSKADISGKDAKKQLNTEDLETTKNALQQKRGDLQDAQSLLDSALKVLEDLKPTCTDSAMPYFEGTSKRDDEIDALYNALCILDVDKVETQMCNTQGNGLR